MVDVGDGGPEIFYRGNRHKPVREEVFSIGPIRVNEEFEFSLPDVPEPLESWVPDSVKVTPGMLRANRLIDFPIKQHSLTRTRQVSRFETLRDVEDGFYSEMSQPVQRPKPGVQVGLGTEQDLEKAMGYQMHQAQRWIRENACKKFGEGENADGSLLDVIYSDPFQRLRFIDQHGPQSYRKNNPQVDRFEHSIGVMMLLRKFDASRDEQVAALLHDLGHGPFSHWAEFVLDDGEGYEYHEKMLEERLEDSGLGGRLKDYGLDLEYLLEKENFPLLEQPKPDLCADRIDYFLRDLYYVAGQAASPELSGPLEDHPDQEETKMDVEWQEIVDYVDSLEVHGEGDNRQFVMTDPERAVEFAERFIQMDRQIWSEPINNMAQYKGVADAARKALNHGDVSNEEFFAMKDLEVINSLIPRYQDSREHMEVVEKYFTKENLSLVEEDDDWDLHLESRSGWVDPKVKQDEDQAIETMDRASDYSSELENLIEDYQAEGKGGFYIFVEGLDYSDMNPMN